MTLTIEFTPEEATWLCREAEHKRLPPEQVLREMIDERIPVEQSDVQCLFEQADRPAERRLRDVRHPRGLAEAQIMGDLHEQAKARHAGRLRHADLFIDTALVASNHKYELIYA